MRTMNRAPVEWPTAFVLVFTYAVWGFATFGLSKLSVVAAILVAALAIAQHASLTHEAIHGHPFKNRHLNAALVWPALGLIYPFARFRDTHLAHHGNCELTDPYDDPESNFLDPKVWRNTPRWCRTLLVLNNTLLGRLILGPIIGTAFFIGGELRRANGDPAVLRGWLWHMPALAAVLLAVALSPMPLWAYFAAAYLGNAMIRIRTFLEHRAHEHARGRSVIIEDRGPLAFLFLNNNLHAVHHMHPTVPWYDLPALYRRKRDHFLAANEGYFYRSYSDIVRQYLFRPKDPVPHPGRTSE